MLVTLLGVVTGILIGVATGVIVEHYRHRLQRKQTADEWYGTALGIISRTERIGHRTTDLQSTTDAETLCSKLEPLSEELRDHAADAPSTIPQEARDRLKFLSNITTGLIIVFEQKDEMTGTELLTTLQKGFRGGSDNEGKEFPDIELVNEIIAPAETNVNAENIPNENLNLDDEKIDNLFAGISDETIQTQQIKSIDDALNFPFEEANELLDEVDIVDEIMEDGMREYVRLWLLEITDDIYNEMEARKERV